MTIVLDTKPQIQMWVMLSRRHQIRMHLKGYPVKGLVTCLKREFGDHGRTVKDYVVPVEFAISEAGGSIDYSLVNVHVMLSRGGLFFDRGIFESMDAVEADEDNRLLWDEGRLEIVLTMEEPRPANKEVFVGA